MCVCVCVYKNYYKHIQREREAPKRCVFSPDDPTLYRNEILHKKKQDLQAYKVSCFFQIKYLLLSACFMASFYYCSGRKILKFYSDGSVCVCTKTIISTYKERGRPRNGAYSLLMTQHYLEMKYSIRKNRTYKPTR